MSRMIHLDTIMLCTFMAMIATAIAMFIVWMNKPEEKAAGLWSISFLLGAGGCMIIAVGRNMLPPGVGPVAHFLLTTGSYVGLWYGFKAFNGQALKHLPALIVTALWFTAFFAWPDFARNPDLGATAQSTIVGLFALACAYTVYTGRESRNLPMTLPVTVLLLAHGVIHLSHLVYISQTVPSGGVLGRSLWWQIMMLEMFIHTVSIAIACVILIKDRSEERHRIASETDTLTGIANRRAFVKNTEKMLETANESAALAIIDLDHFKRINDQHGHQAGDQVLISFANTISANLPAEAAFGRMGGEEFGIFLPQSADEPEAILEALREKVAGTPVRYQGIDIQVTISAGIARVAKAGNGFDLLVAAADCALYIAKENGRNRMVAFSPSQRLHKIMEKDGEKRIGLADERVSRKTARSVTSPAKA